MSLKTAYIEGKLLKQLPLSLIKFQTILVSGHLFASFYCVTILDQILMSQHTSKSNCVFITIALSVIIDRLIFTECLITAASIYKGCSHA